MNLGLAQNQQVLLNLESPLQYEAKFINVVFFAWNKSLHSLHSIEVAWAFFSVGVPIASIHFIEEQCYHVAGIQVALSSSTAWIQSCCPRTDLPMRAHKVLCVFSVTSRGRGEPICPMKADLVGSVHAHKTEQSLRQGPRSKRQSS